MSVLLKRLLSGFIFDNLFIAFCALGLTKASRAILHLPLDFAAVDLFVYFSTLFVYNLHKSLSLLREQSAAAVMRLVFSSQLSWSMRLLIRTGLAGTAASFFFLYPVQQLLVLALGLVTFAYSFPVLKIRNSKKRIRELFIVKALVISGVWSFVTVLLPLAMENFSTESFYLLFAERLLFILAITVPFEIRDAEQEKKWGNRTLPIVLGTQKSKLLAYILLALFCCLVMAHYLFTGTPEPKMAGALTLSAAVSAVLIYFTNEHRSNLYYKFYVDGTMLLQFIFVILVSQ